VVEELKTMSAKDWFLIDEETGKRFIDSYLEKKFRELIGEKEDIDTTNIVKEVEDYINAGNEIDPVKVVEFHGILNYISTRILQVVGITYSVDDFIDNGVPEEIIKEHDSIDKSNLLICTPKIDAVYDKLTDVLYERGNHLGVLVRSKTRGNSKNIGNSFLAYGYKLDSDSSVIPRYVNKSLFDGISEAEDLYVSAVSSRNALLQAVSSIPDSGYLYRKLSQLVKDVKLSNNDSCYIHPELNEFLIKINITEDNKNIYLERNIQYEGEDYYLTKENINDFVGKTVRIYSPITCQDPEPYGVCKRCYGGFHKGLENYTNTGIFSAMLFCSQVTQSLLSSKHLQFVNLSKFPHYVKERIEYDPDRNVYIAKEDFSESFSRTNDTTINFNSINMDINFQYPVINKIENGKTYSFKKGDVVFNLSNDVFYSVDMTAGLKRLNQLFDIPEAIKYYRENLELYLKDFSNFCNSVLNRFESIHLEIFISMMARNLDEPKRLYRWHLAESYEIKGLSNALMNKHPFDVLLFERVKETLSGTEILTSGEIHNSAFYDIFFKKETR
jgi:hypothetical protein